MLALDCRKGMSKDMLNEEVYFCRDVLRSVADINCGSCNVHFPVACYVVYGVRQQQQAE